MASDENEAQQIVADVFVDRGLEVRRGWWRAVGGHVAKRSVLGLEHLPPAELVDGAIFRGGHQPGAGVFGDPSRGPALEGDEERFLREILREADSAKHTREAGD